LRRLDVVPNRVLKASTMDLIDRQSMSAGAAASIVCQIKIWNIGDRCTFAADWWHTWSARWQVARV